MSDPNKKKPACDPDQWEAAWSDRVHLDPDSPYFDTKPPPSRKFKRAVFFALFLLLVMIVVDVSIAALMDYINGR